MPSSTVPEGRLHQRTVLAELHGPKVAKLDEQRPINYGWKISKSSFGAESDSALGR